MHAFDDSFVQNPNILHVSLFKFNSFICVIKDMLNRLEAEHKTKLEQLHVMQEQQK